MAHSAVGVDTATTDVDRALISASAAGDRDAYDSLLGDRLSQLYHTALGILRSDADAQDAVQDACVQAWRNIRSLREPDRFDAWLGRILVNACREQLRTRRRANVREIDVAAVPDQEATAPSSLADETADLDAIRRAFERLKPDDRILLGLHHADRRPVYEIAALLGIPEGTAKSRLFSARKALAVALGREQ